MHTLFIVMLFFQIEISLAKMVFIILIIWVFAWTPYVIQSMWIMCFDGSNLTPEMGIAPSLCCKLSAAFNAFLYGSTASVLMIYLNMHLMFYS